MICIKIIYGLKAKLSLIGIILCSPYYILCYRIFLILMLFSQVFIYCGTVLDNDNQTLNGYNVRAETMIQVFPKQHDMEYKSEPATSEQINAAVSSYRGIFKEMASSSSTVNSILIASNAIIQPFLAI